MKKILLVFLTLLLMFFSISCSNKVEQMPKDEMHDNTHEQSNISNITKYENVPKGISPLTGLPYEGDGRAIMVQLENTPAARPHSGISKADLIYEMEVEDKITRLTAFFLSDYPEKVGPVRSIRKQHVELWTEWDYLYTFFGGSANTPGQDVYELMINLKMNRPNLNGHKGGASFFRSNDREAPHNAYTNLKVALEHYDYTPKARSLYFYEKADIKGETAKNIELAYNSNNKIKYVYNENTGLYERYINNEPMIDKENNEQIAVKNIIIQKANHYKVKDTVYTNIDLIGSGEALYFTDGIMRIGKWRRDSVDSLTRFYDENGQEIPFKPGVSFIQIVRSDAEIIVR